MNKQYFIYVASFFYFSLDSIQYTSIPLCACAHMCV